MIIRMLKYFRLSSAVLIYLFVSACTPDSKRLPSLKAQDTISSDGMNSSIVQTEQNGLLIESMLKANAVTDELYLLMAIKNDKDEAIAVDPMFCNLSLDDGREALPDAPPQATTIFSGETKYFKFTYRPINNVEYYTRTGYRGDFEKKYRLSLLFIKQQNNSVSDQVLEYEFPNAAYGKYLQKAKEKNIHIFDFAFDSDQFAKKQESYLRKLFPQDSGDYEVFAIIPSIAINRVISNFQTFKDGDTLTVDIRMLNQSPRKLDIVASRCTLKQSNDIVVSPCAIYSDSFDKNVVDSIYAFKPGTRLHLNLKYFIDKHVDEWQLSRNWILLQIPDVNKNSKSMKSLFHSDIPFNESSITKKI